MSKKEEMKTLMGLTCTMQDHRRFNKSKGLIYTKDFNMENTTSFKHCLKTKYQVLETVEAKWIKSLSPEMNITLLELLYEQ